MIITIINKKKVVVVVVAPEDCNAVSSNFVSSYRMPLIFETFV
jgi:hypothetical protein